MNKADVLIDVHPDLDDSEREDLLGSVDSLNGVLHARFNPRKPRGHALYVEYDPEVITAQAILKEVRGFDLDARMASL